MASLGIEPHKLYLISFDDFIYIHPELRNVSFDWQQSSYSHFENKRHERINRLIQKRREIIAASNNQSDPSTKLLTEYSQDWGSTLIKNEKEKLENLKKKQMAELRNWIEFEFQMEEARNRNEEKWQNHLKKVEKLNQQKKKEAKKMEWKHQIMQQQKQERLKYEKEELVKKGKEQTEEEKRWYWEECKRKEEIEKDRKRREYDLKQRHEEFRRKVENILTIQQNELLEKQKEMIKKDEIRKKNIEELKREKYMLTLDKQRKIKDKIEMALLRNDSLLSSRKNEIETKHLSSDLIHRKVRADRLWKKREQEVYSKKKEEDILLALDELIQKRLDTYTQKQRLVEEKQRERDISLKRKIREKQIQILEKDQKCIQARQKHDTMVEDNRKKILEKINLTDHRIQKQKEINQRQNLISSIQESNRKEDIKESVRENEKAQEFQRQQRLAMLEEKDRKIAKLQQQKKEWHDQRRQMNRDIVKHREKMWRNFDTIMKNKDIEKDELIKRLFESDVLFSGYNYDDFAGNRSNKANKELGYSLNKERNNNSNSNNGINNIMKSMGNKPGMSKNEDDDFKFWTNVNTEKNENNYIDEENDDEAEDKWRNIDEVGD